jgi:two-component system, sensor histidine kinase and response regulator
LKLNLILLLLLIPLVNLAAPEGSSGSDSSKVNRLNRQATASFMSNPDSTFFYAKESIALSKKINYPTGLADGLVQEAHVYYFKGKSNEAVRNFDQAILIYKQLNDRKGLATCYVLYGRMANQLADYGQALKYLNMALAIDKKKLTSMR